jgi:hypothetical protein
MDVFTVAAAFSASRVSVRSATIAIGTLVESTFMQIGSIVQSRHIAVPSGAFGIVTKILGDMAMVTWYAGQPGASRELSTEPFFITDLIDTGDLLPSRPINASRAQLH